MADGLRPARPEPPTLVIATTNPRKGGEMLEILGAARPDLRLLTLADFPAAPEVEETGDTFLENARLKALAGVAASGLPCIADDGGLCIDALDGSPGVKSHRFLGLHTSFAEKMARILEMMDGLPDEERACRFECAVVIATPADAQAECAGVCEGRVGRSLRGTLGFGYDPLFLLPELGRHMAELTPDEKHRISHRGRALACAVRALSTLLPPV